MNTSFYIGFTLTMFVLSFMMMYSFFRKSVEEKIKPSLFDVFFFSLLLTFGIFLMYYGVLQ